MSKTSVILLIVVIGLIILSMVLSYYLIDRSIKITQNKVDNIVKTIKSNMGKSCTDESMTVMDSLDQISATLGQISYGTSLMSKCSDIKEELDKLTEYTERNCKGHSKTDHPD